MSNKNMMIKDMMFKGLVPANSNKLKDKTVVVITGLFYRYSSKKNLN